MIAKRMPRTLIRGESRFSEQLTLKQNQDARSTRGKVIFLQRVRVADPISLRPQPIRAIEWRPTSEMLVAPVSAMVTSSSLRKISIARCTPA